MIRIVQFAFIEQAKGIVHVFGSATWTTNSKWYPLMSLSLAKITTCPFLLRI